MLRTLKGEVALITGASRGIGKAIALQLAQEGVDLALTARTTSTLENTAQLCTKKGARVLTLALDLTDSRSLATLVKKTTAKLGKLNTLINNVHRSIR